MKPAIYFVKTILMVNVRMIIILTTIIPIAQNWVRFDKQQACRSAYDAAVELAKYP